MRRSRLAGLIVGIAALFYSPATALAQLSSFGVLGGSAITNTGPTGVNGNLGISPGTSVTGFPPGVVTAGSMHLNDAVAAQAQSDLTTFYNQLAGSPCTANLTGQDLGGLTLMPGVYCFDSSAQLTGTLILNGAGNSAATFIFKIGSTLTTASASSVSLMNGASSCGVAWQVGSSATLGSGTALAGTIAALTSITLNTGSSLNGRALARNGAVTLDTNNVSFCSGPGLSNLPAPPEVSGVPTMSLPALAGLALLLAGLGTVLARKAQASR